MTKDNHWTTAEEIMAGLAHNPEYRRRVAERDARLRKRQDEFDRGERPIVETLNSVGFAVASIDELVIKHAPLSGDAINVLLGSLNACMNRDLKESIIRALAAAAEPFDGRPLAECYDKTQDANLQWAIINTIAINNPHSINEWLQRASTNQWFRKTLKELRG